jgi:hypothetical protein
LAIEPEKIHADLKSAIAVPGLFPAKLQIEIFKMRETRA